MHKILKKFIAIITLMIVGFCSKAQTNESLSKLENLLVNTWKPETLVIDGKDVPLTKVQTEGRFQFLANHTSKQLYDELTENGTWVLNEKEMTISITTEAIPDEAVILKIITLTDKKFVFSILNEDTNQNMVFSNVVAGKN